MGLLSIIRKIKRKEKEMRILMVGLDNSGKTTIVLKINGEDTSVISPTLGFNIKTIAYQKYALNIWDVGGQKTIRAYWRNYFEQTDGLIWVVDSSDIRRLDDCRDELHNLLKEEVLFICLESFSIWCWHISMTKLKEPLMECVRNPFPMCCSHHGMMILLWMPTIRTALL
ncbi:ADP-ribosylation factor-like protein 2 isoform X3 [Beta vulgaris subsp. vulgaris]|uniref:ADP-ribosylation factor-like protein 2 isoform X3 n=1 Tax=Beta vulgaris subsp. vulgaris TaxID=3555 RepID=UPI002036D9C7|nr:ADP-ribosylation factor-like protein 2 isoform X3 [Beta vulgaris subsp. vulgaris]